jgi:hypothetical protein
VTETISLTILLVIGVITISGFAFIWFKINKSQNEKPVIIEDKIPPTQTNP